VKVKTLLIILIFQISFFKEVFSKNDSLYFFTSNLVFVPTQSSIFEPRMGVTKYLNIKNLNLEIGATLDLIGYKEKQNTFSFGVDLFTFSNLRSESNFKFPVDAIDYFFGVNFNFKRKISEKYKLSGRLRISHISSHLEDGHKYENTDTIFTPFVFSEEFLNLAAMTDYDINKHLSFKGLLALNYIFHAIPNYISNLSGQLGLEFRNYFTRILSLYISNNLNLASVNSNTTFNENFETGLSIGKLNTRSINFYFDYYDGQDYRGQYYGNYLNYKGLGMRFRF
jgi:hypothetical protein